MVEIRFAVQEEINEISSLVATGWRNAYRSLFSEKFLAQINDNHWTRTLSSGLSKKEAFPVVMLENGALIGVMVIYKTKEESCAELSSCYLLPEKIGTGYGHALHTWVEGETKKMGFTKCTCNVFEGNDRAARFIEAHGFALNGKTAKIKLGDEFHCLFTYEKSLL